MGDGEKDSPPAPPSPPTPVSCSFGNWMEPWSLTSIQTRVIKTGGRLVFELAEVLVSLEMLTGLLERIRQLCPTPG